MIFKTKVKPRTSKAFISEAPRIEFHIVMPVLSYSSEFNEAAKAYEKALLDYGIFFEEAFNDDGENFRIIDALLKLDDGTTFRIELEISISRS